ncbi:DUF6153 family protein [Streptomyces sp. NPDC005931]|uniref:DUF6153 family protein n=1 Tax=Streptomyces sp. NPDC005931 TaxID=3364737 RepID=UPI0036CA249F
MSGFERRVRRSPVRWSPRALCVLALLAGLLGMHGLVPGAAAPGHTHPAHHARAEALAAAGPGVCHDDGHGGGHLQHADPTCAAAAVSGPPVLPAPLAAPSVLPADQDALRAYPSGEPDGARAPPSLAELQLLRI